MTRLSCAFIFAGLAFFLSGLGGSDAVQSQNGTLEERVSTLEEQLADLQEDILSASLNEGIPLVIPAESGFTDDYIFGEVKRFESGLQTSFFSRELLCRPLPGQSGSSFGPELVALDCIQIKRVPGAELPSFFE